MMGSGEVTERLLAATAAAVAERGITAATVADIARGAGLTTGAIYSRWPSKLGLVVAAVEWCCERVAVDGGDIAADVVLEAFVSARRDVDFRDAVSGVLAGVLGSVGVEAVALRLGRRLVDGYTRK